MTSRLGAWRARSSTCPVPDVLLGVDFDNTIVQYDDLFHRVAVERRLVPPSLPATKSHVRDYLRSVGNEDAWTELQGYVYGARMQDAAAFPGVIEFLTRCRQAGIEVRIVSHKTRQPFLGPKYDLHGAAMDWLTTRGFFRPDLVNLRTSDVFFEVTKDAKLRRIGELGCTHFVDDLPEFLLEPAFPEGVDRVLFDPSGAVRGVPFRIARSWQEVEAVLPAPGDSPQTAVRQLVEHVLSSVGSVDVEAVCGGGNNRAFVVSTNGRRYFAKQYFRRAGDTRDRLAADFGVCRFAWAHGIRACPEPIAADPRAGVALYEFVNGRRPAQVGEADVNAAVAFYRALNAARDEATTTLPEAAEACFSLAEHVSCIERRVQSLLKLSAPGGVDAEAVELIHRTLAPAWTRLLEASRRRAAALGLSWTAGLPHSERRLSPSDFGFHNALRRDDGSLVFFDFEYAGWDDPAKMVADFFLQPAVPVPGAWRDTVIAAVAADLAESEQFRARVDVLTPLYDLKWACILLNDFLPMGSARRQFAQSGANPEHRKATQLAKARVRLASI